MEFRQHFISSLKIQKGFTLIEVLIVVGLVSVVAALGLGVLGPMRERAMDEKTGKLVLATLREAQNRSLASENGVAWGVRCDHHNLVEFSYTPTEPEKNPQIIPLPGEYSCTILPGIIRFQKLTGIPEVNSAITLSLGSQSVARIAVEQPGVISLEKL
jgi:prepilin-type N-terminal cleavage/methylation domain-containing protein